MDTLTITLTAPGIVLDLIRHMLTSESDVILTTPNHAPGYVATVVQVERTTRTEGPVQIAEHFHPGEYFGCREDHRKDT